ncbi:rhomboid family intramembrane serine protease [Actinomyces haliotis]|uniref:rhomboid family intramembrane serine protease n=1 Tax=Actinomyces haliotis TaxID=1280843 RepID=UPI00188FC323|nr:rhomboid family intramembrane serine protease [Actinomyces haliotis]
MSQSQPVADDGQPPVCPRHPDRVSYVRCQRCERPVCPECQVASSVGVHCVDCARESAGRRRGARTLLGGTAVADATVTRVLIVACVAVYLAQRLVPSVTGDLAMVPGLTASQPWRLLTTAFLHASLMHLALNMWALWVCGTVLEPVLGRWRYCVLYLLSALGGSTAILCLADPSGDSWWTATVGASGAVFGLFGAMFVIQHRFGRDTSAILGLLAVNLLISFLGSGISWQGHLGGLVTGALVASLYAWAPRERRTSAGVWGSVGIGVVLVAGCVLRLLL